MRTRIWLSWEFLYRKFSLIYYVIACISLHPYCHKPWDTAFFPSMIDQQLIMIHKYQSPNTCTFLLLLISSHTLLLPMQLFALSELWYSLSGECPCNNVFWILLKVWCILSQFSFDWECLMSLDFSFIPQRFKIEVRNHVQYVWDCYLIPISVSSDCPH